SPAFKASNQERVSGPVKTREEGCIFQHTNIEPTWRERSMTDHRLGPDRANLHGMYSSRLEPVLVVESGDGVRCRTRDVSWGLEPRRPDSDWRETVQPREAPRDSGPCLLGPIAVRGAEPGDLLEVHLENIVPGPWGWTVAGEIGFFNTDLNRRLGVFEGERLMVRWEIDVAAGRATSHLGQTVPIRPFLGTLGLCPAGDDWISAWPP